MAGGPILGRNGHRRDFPVRRGGGGSKVPLLVIAAGVLGKDGFLRPSDEVFPAVTAFNTRPALDPTGNTLRVPFTAKMGPAGNDKLSLIGRGSLANTHDLALIARRWQAVYFDAAVKVKFEPFSYQQMAGLTNY